MTAKGWYVYGIIEPDLEPTEAAAGVGDPPARVDRVASAGVAALVSEIATDQPLGSIDDLMAHQRLLDALVLDAPVLPMRFGAVLDSSDAVVHELLEPHEEEFKRALDELRDTVQYVVRARYREEEFIREVLASDQRARQLRDAIAGQPEESTQDHRIQLGTIVSQAVEANRAADTGKLLELLEPIGIATAQRDPTHEMDAAHVAVLIATEREDELTDALTDLAEEWSDRAEVRLLGPMAPYDFVVAPAPDEGRG